LAYSTVITGLIYPVVVHWGWDPYGWASPFNIEDDGRHGPVLGGMVDFAGSGIVHMTGGVAGLAGAVVLGPRAGRYVDGKPVPLHGQSTVLQVLGTFILWMGWYGFNPGSTLAITPEGYAGDAARAIVCTTLSGAAGCLTTLVLEKIFFGAWDLGAASNGLLAGLVSISAGCSVTYPYAALIIGFLGGFVYISTSKLLIYKLHVDDPLDAFAVHGACGFWGVIAAAFFAAPPFAYSGRVAETDCPEECAGKGSFYGCGCLLGAAVTFLAANIAWTGCIATCLFLTLKRFDLLRVDAAI